jgi:hypothetical protein
MVLDHARYLPRNHPPRGTTTPSAAWYRTFPAAPQHVRDARRFLAGFLDGHPAADGGGTWNPDTGPAD